MANHEAEAADATEAGALDRLETALDRIARRAAPAARHASADPQDAVIAARLDALIAQLRDALATGAGV